MSDVQVTTIRRPLRSGQLGEYVDAAMGLSGDDVDREQVSEEVLAVLEIKAAFRSVTRRQAHRRGDLREEVLDWIVEESGQARTDIDLEKMPPRMSDEFLARMQSCDILGCIVWDQCEGLEFGAMPPPWLGDVEIWQAEEDPGGWPDCMDWLFSRLLAAAWEANPQWSLAAGNIPFG